MLDALLLNLDLYGKLWQKASAVTGYAKYSHYIQMFQVWTCWRRGK